MNNQRPYLHFKNTSDYIIHLLISLLPLLCYGLYKNGILVFLSDDTSFLGILKPLSFPFLGCLAGAMTDLFFWWKHRNKKIWTFLPVQGLIMGMSMPIGANIFLFFLFSLLFFSIFRAIQKKYSWISPFILTTCLLMVLFISLGKISFANNAELHHEYIYSMIDILFGRSIGGVCSTSIFWMMIAFLFLSFNFYYKKEIPLTIFGTYFIAAIVFEVILPSGDVLKMILNSSVIFSSLFLASDITSSPYMDGAKIAYSIMIGFLSFLFNRFGNPFLGIYISTATISLFVPIFNQLSIKFTRKK